MSIKQVFLWLLSLLVVGFVAWKSGNEIGFKKGLRFWYRGWLRQRKDSRD